MINQDMNSRDGFVYDARLYYGMSFLYPHLHRSAEIIHVIKGEILVDINAVRTHVPAGKCVLILPYRLHSFECAPDALFMVRRSFSVCSAAGHLSRPYLTRLRRTSRTT